MNLSTVDHAARLDLVVVVDPTLGRLRRRYFSQPRTGRGRRAFTESGARGTGWQYRLADRWRRAREIETVRRRGAVWF